MIKKLNINDILVNPENPRHVIAISGEELFVMKKLLENPKDINKMYDLICNIYKNGWFEESIITVIYDEKTTKYVAWDGNRRLTALKILQNSKLSRSFEFSKKQVSSIENMSIKIDKSFFNLNCSIKSDFQSLAQYILSIHTNISAGLTWEKEAKDRFEHLYGNKNKSIYQIFYEEFPDIFNKGKISPTTFERIVGSKPGKDYLGYTIKNNSLTYEMNKESFKTKIIKIFEDLLYKKVNSRMLNTVSNIERYFNNESTEDINEITDIDVDLFKNVDNKNNEELIKLVENSTSSGNEQINIIDIDNDKKNITEECVTNIQETENIDNIKQQVPLPQGNIKSKINGASGLHFKYITCNSVPDENANLGLISMVKEIKKISINSSYLYHPISTTLLIRSLLESSLKFYFSNKLPTHWNNLKKTYTRDIALGDILKYTKKYSSNYVVLFGDLQFCRLWSSIFENPGLKDSLDLITHQIDKAIPDGKYIESISNSGLYSIIQYLLNC